MTQYEIIDKDEVLKMAIQAGFRHPNPHDGYMGLAYDRRDETDTGPSLEAFAKLVAAAAASKEREACALLVEREWSTNQEKALCDELAAYIRARGEA